jgi:DNA-binding response OmpR family regulator
VLITDIQLKGIDGLTLMDLVAHIARLPIIVITARTEEELRIRAASKGCAAFLRKPFDPGLLLGLVAAALR